MGIIWKMIDHKEWDNRTKSIAFMCIVSLIFAVLGLMAWLIVCGAWIPSYRFWPYAVAFMAYPAFAAFIVAFVRKA